MGTAQPAIELTTDELQQLDGVTDQVSELLAFTGVARLHGPDAAVWESLVYGRFLGLTQTECARRLGMHWRTFCRHKNRIGLRMECPERVAELQSRGLWSVYYELLHPVTKLHPIKKTGSGKQYEEIRRRG